MRLREQISDLYWRIKDTKTIRNFNKNPDSYFIYLPKDTRKTFIDIYIKAGAVTEKKEQAGIGHLLEHYIAGLINKKLGHSLEFGGKINDDYIVFYLEQDKDTWDADTAGSFLHTIFAPNFDDQELFDSEKRSIIGELSKEQNETGLRLERLVEETRYDDEPDKRSFVDHLPSVEKLTLEDVSEYHRQIFTKGNVKILISSSNPEKKIEDMLSERLSKMGLPEGEMYYPIPEYSDSVVRIVEDSNIRGQYVVMTFPSISKMAKLKEKIILSMMTDLLRDTDVHSLIRGSGIYDLDISYSQGMHNGYFAIKSYLVNEQVVPWVHIVRDLIHNLKSGEPGRISFQKAKEAWVRANLRYWRSNQGRFDVLSGLILTQGENISRREIYALVMSVSESDIQEMCQKIFAREKVNLVIYGEPVGLAQKELEGALIF
jgi:predicted Zn-dependent peptidase